MIKHYKSKSSISINVVLKNGQNVHVPFIIQSDGSSMFVTSNPELQHALEHHYKFGRLFRLIHEEPDDKLPEECSDESNGGTDARDVKEGYRTVKVSDLAAAKDYLAEKFGISRTSLRSEKSIRESAKAHHIEFEVLE